MRIGIDARELCGHATGAGRYLSGLLHQWAADEGMRRHEFILYAPERLSAQLDSRRFATRLIEGGRGHLVGAGAAAGRDGRRSSGRVLCARVYRAASAARADRCRDPRPVVRRASGMVSDAGRMRRRVLTRQSAWRAGAVVTISEFSRRELIERLGVPDTRVHVIPPGVSTPSDGLGPGAQTGPPGGPRRRPRAVRRLDLQPPPPAGSRSCVWHPRASPSAGVARSGGRQPNVSPRESRAHHRDGRARRPHPVASVPGRPASRSLRPRPAFAFLSEYEGLGLTPLEALAAGVPPLLLDTPVARESCGDAALYVGPGDLSGTADALEQILADEATRSRLLAAAPAALARYRWPEAAQRWQLETSLEHDLKGVPTNAFGDLALGDLSDLDPRTHRSVANDDDQWICPSSSSRSTRARTSSAASRRCTRLPRRRHTRSSSSTISRGTAVLKPRGAGAASAWLKPAAIWASPAPTTPASGRARGTNLLLLNSDTIVPPGAVDGLVEELRRDETVAVVGPRLVDAAGRAELSFGRMIGPFNELRQKVLVRGHEKKVGVIAAFVERATNRPRFPDWVSGACLLVRRQDADAVGLLDERYFMYAEDVDFCAAIRARGRRVRFTPAVTVAHLRGRSAATARAATDAAYRQKPAGLLRKTSPAMDAAPPLVFASPRYPDSEGIRN